MHFSSPQSAPRHDSYQMSVSGAPAASGSHSTSQSRLSALRAWFTQRRRRRSAKSAGVVLTHPSSPPESGGRHSPLSHTSVASPTSSPTVSHFRFGVGDVGDGGPGIECPLCLCEIVEPSATSSSASSASSASSGFSAASVTLPSRLLLPCRHAVCLSCWQQYLRVQINDSHVPVTCPVCPAHLHPDDVLRLLQSLPTPGEGKALKEKYELYTVRRVLAACADVRWCPAPDCHFALIAEKCERCPRLKCLRPGCGTVFCYRCKQTWHPGKSCKTARAAKIAEVLSAIDPLEGEVKKCPECGMYVLKMNDGTCNHMVCNICGCEFCWLCMSKVGDMHFLSPSGCTFWGRKPWSRRKRLFLQVATLVGAPVGIALLAGLAVPALTFGIPVWAGRRAVRNFEEPDIHKLRLNAVLAVFFSFMLSPFIAAVVVGVGVPVLFAYVYTVVPVALCRSLESACSCADIRDRFLDCLEGSVDDVHNLPTRLDDTDFTPGASTASRSHESDGFGSSFSTIRARLRSWLQRLRGEDSASLGQSNAQSEEGRRKSRRRNKRKRRRDGSRPEETVEEEGRCPHSLTPEDLLHLEAILLEPGADGDTLRVNETACTSNGGSQQLRVEVHAEMPPQPPSSLSPDQRVLIQQLAHHCGSGSSDPTDNSCHSNPDASGLSCALSVGSVSRSTTPMTTVEVDAPSVAATQSPAAPESTNFPDYASIGHVTEETGAQLVGPKPQRAKSLDMNHELVMLRHLSAPAEDSVSGSEQEVHRHLSTA